MAPHTRGACLLFGYLDQSIIARLECDERPITLAVATVCELIFGCEPKEIFPALYEQIEASVIHRMHELYERLEKHSPSQKTAAKLQLLREALARIANRPEGREV